MAFFDARITVSNHIDKTSYIISYVHKKEITKELIEKRIKYDIIGLMRDIRVDKDVTHDDIANAICELSMDGKRVELYSKHKVNGLWHTGATVSIRIKDTYSSNTVTNTETPRCPPPSPVPLSVSIIPFQDNDIVESDYICDAKKPHDTTDDGMTAYVDSLRTGKIFSTGLAAVMKRLQIVDDDTEVDK